MDHLIPFGLSVTTNQLVDISEVERGAKCNCICPSCKHPLIARHGNINEWHFAHDSHFDSGINYSECDYSWYSAIKLMLKQLLTLNTLIAVPDYYYTHPDLQHPYQIAKANIIEYQSVELDSKGYDAILSVNGKNLALFFEHEGRYCTFSDNSSVQGLLVVDLGELKKSLILEKGVKNTHTFLVSLLATQHKCKLWRYHAREHIERPKIDRLIQQALALKAQREKEQLEELQRRQRPRANRPSGSKNRARFQASTFSVKPDIIIGESVNFEACKYHCIACKVVYNGLSNGKNNCPKCGSYYYRTRIS